MSTEQDLIYDGHAVYQGMTDQARLRTGPDNVSDVLDSLNRLTKAARQQALPGHVADARKMIMVPADQLIAMMSHNDHDTRINAERSLLAALAASPQAEHMLSAAPAPAERVEQEPVAHLIIGEPEQTTNGWEHGEWDIEYDDKAIEKLAVLGGGSYPLYTAPQPSTAPAAPDVADLIRAGALLSNIAYNLAQTEGRPLLDKECASMDQARKRWDAALSIHRQQEG